MRDAYAIQAFVFSPFTHLHPPSTNQQRSCTPLLLACYSTLLGLGLGQITLGTEKGAAADSWEWASCVHLRPTPPDLPKIGRDPTVTVDLDVVETIKDDMAADVLVKVGRIKLLQTTFDICEEAQPQREHAHPILCPIELGVYQIVQTVELPKEGPKQYG
ncbi:hypothetical protein B0H14DRAFT_3485831 [Mycena olivaceomarginata]|nr:hypothetical protein B0H14DRAFT_3485831 [Mycena olivaceomarginata]